MSEKDRVIVTQGTYVASAVRPDQYPEKALPEIAFIGRSNVGKSSLINNLTRMGGLARVSRQPGKTQTINFFEIGIKLEGQVRQGFYLVDLPGYGYAKTGRDKRRTWAKFIQVYFLKSKRLSFVCQLIDIRHPPMASDIEMFRFLVKNNVPVLIVATKADKIGKNVCAKNIAAIKKVLGVPELSVLPYSSLKSEGRSDLLDVIGDSLVQ